MSDPSFSGLRSKPLYQLTRARVLEFLREPEAVFWVFIFPLLLALALGVAFRSQAPKPLPVGVEAGVHAESRRAALAASPALTVVVLAPADAERALATGKVAVIVRDTDPPTFWLDLTRPESREARLHADDALQRAAGRQDPLQPREELLTARGSRYIDFLVPGLLGMNLMGTGMWAIGFSLVQQRNGKLLKLFVASPMRRWHLLAAQVLGRLVFLTLEVAILIAFAVWVLDVPLRGSVALLALVAVIGAMAFVGIGLLIAARPRTIEGVSGLMNLVMFPMWIGSGTFFSTERFPQAAQPFVQALPLTALNDALRAVMLHGDSLRVIAPELGILAVWGVVAFVFALKLFRWQ